MSRYISNGTEGDIWTSRWCDRCAEDHDYSHIANGDGADGCRIILRLILDEYPIPELTEHTDKGWPDALECRMFSPCQRCHPGRGDEPPQPPPADPNQGLLFEVVDQVDVVPMLIIPIEPALARTGEAL